MGYSSVQCLLGEDAQTLKKLDEVQSLRGDIQASEDADQSGRGGLFTINKLIHRVAGNGGQDGGASRLERREPTTPAIDEDGGEIPAFLRRQAN